MNDIYCHISLNLSESADLTRSLVNRLSQQLSTIGSTIYKQQWKQKVTSLGIVIVYWAHTASTPRIKDNGCTGWPTTSQRDYKGDYLGSRIRNGKLSIDTLDVTSQLATGWRTPTASDSARGPKSEMNYLDCLKTGKHSINLVDEAKFAEWATPNTMDVLPVRSPQAMYNQSRNGMRKNRSFPANLREQVDPVMQQIYQDSKKDATLGITQTGYIAETKSIGQLNPALSRWLMGFPVEWDLAAIAAQQTLTALKTRKKRE